MISYFLGSQFEAKLPSATDACLNGIWSLVVFLHLGLRPRIKKRVVYRHLGFGCPQADMSRCLLHKFAVYVRTMGYTCPIMLVT